MDEDVGAEHEREENAVNGYPELGGGGERLQLRMSAGDVRRETPLQEGKGGTSLHGGFYPRLWEI